ncbi:uncharacterized protein LOC124157587 isoform X3 [Ischnura elegans]|uniref:uncharacterized protein LOC124157587 isoform X3 n=1 Tax=Ischnura elegans TaxID=197161 RepID=UPI001ED8B2DA|nr:uncharacterized protein LOC124157587 isoform X3 [Ischnura elegans]
MIEASSHSGRRISKQRSSGSAQNGCGKYSNYSLSSTNGNHEEHPKKSKGRTRSHIARNVTSGILGPSIGDTLIGAVEFASPLLRSVTSRRSIETKERRSANGSSIEYHGRTATSENSFQRKKKERRCDRGAGFRKGAVNQLRMLLTPMLDHVILETAEICCCCCRSKMGARLEQDMRQWKQELKEKREGGYKKPRESIGSKRSRREEDEEKKMEDEEKEMDHGSWQDMDDDRMEGQNFGRSRETGAPIKSKRSRRKGDKDKKMEDEEKEMENGNWQDMDDDQMEGENRGRSRETARNLPRRERTTPSETLVESESLNTVLPARSITSKEEESPAAAEEGISKKSNEVPQMMSIGIQLSDNELFPVKTEFSRQKVTTQDKMSQTEEPDVVVTSAVIKGEPERENLCENQSEEENIVASTPIARKPCKNRRNITESHNREATTGSDWGVCRALSLSKGLVETIALQARAIGGALELGTSLLPKESAFSPASHCRDRRVPGGWPQDSVQQSRSLYRIQNSTMNETTAPSARPKPFPCRKNRPRLDMTTESPIQRRTLPRSRSSMACIPPKSNAQERKPTIQERMGICQEPRNDDSVGWDYAVPHFRGTIEEGPLSSATMNYSYYMEGDKSLENESGRKPSCSEEIADLCDETRQETQMINGERFKSSTEKGQINHIDETETPNTLAGRNYLTPCSTRGNRLTHPSGEEINGDGMAPKSRGPCSSRQTIAVPMLARPLNRCNEYANLNRTQVEDNSWVPDENSAMRSSQDHNLYQEVSDAGNYDHVKQGTDEVSSRKTSDNKDNKEGEEVSGEISGGRDILEKGDPGEGKCENKSDTYSSRPPPISTCFEPRCSDAGLTRKDDYAVCRDQPTTREKNLLELEEIPSQDGKTAKVITRREKNTEVKNTEEFGDKIPFSEDSFESRVEKTNAEEIPKQPPTKRNSFLEMLRRKNGYKRSKRISEVSTTLRGKLCTTIEEEETVETKSTVEYADAEEKIKCLEEGARNDAKPSRSSKEGYYTENDYNEATKVGNVWDVERGEKISQNSSETSLRLPVCDRSGNVVGVREMELKPSKSRRCANREPPTEEGRTNQAEPRKGVQSTLERGELARRSVEDPRRTNSTMEATSAADCGRKRLRHRSRREPGSRQKSARVLWAIARINDYGGGERTLEIVETDEKRPDTQGKEPEFGRELIVIAPTSQIAQGSFTATG